MKDALGRNIEYLRLSVTEKCNLKCIYCDPVACKNARPLLSPLDFERIARACAELGVNKVRVTGGEPLMRPDLEDIVGRIAAIDGIRDLCMTTNAHGLSRRVRALREAGLLRVNISLDSLNPERYARITGGGDIEEVLKGIDLSVQCGLNPVKLNIVLIRGVNDCEVDDFIALAKDRPVEVRFIELMPIGKLGETPSNAVSNAELIAQRPWLVKIPSAYESQPSQDYTIEGYAGKIGFISPMSHKFCHRCNRVRVTSDGMLKPCLGVNGELSLLDALKSDDEQLRNVLRDGIYRKPEGHSFDKGFHSERGMSRIGG